MATTRRRPRTSGGGSGSATAAAAPASERFDVSRLIKEFADLNIAADELGVPRRQLYRWLEDGVDEETADRLASRANLHPLLLWGEQWERALAAAANEPVSLFDPFLFDPE